MPELTPCPLCNSIHSYELENRLACPECGHEWDPTELSDEPQPLAVLDANGNQLNNGDTVITIKNLPVKGTAQSIKAGTKVKNIRLVDSDHNIDCRIDGFGKMALKSEFVKKI